MKRGTSIIVKWEDAVLYSSIYPIEDEDWSTHTVETHGAYMCHLPDGSIVLAGDVIDGKRVRAVHVIPKLMILSVRALEASSGGQDE